ncbi:unnamed protein product [Colias eurytheme]|nr:unnamed protein product [Colias eurytheme]
MNELLPSVLTEKASFLQKMYPNDLETDLVQELLHLQSYLSSERISIKPISGSLISLSSFLQEQNLGNIYPNLDIALRMALCTPAANCSEIEGDEDADLVENSQQQSSNLDFTWDDDVPLCESRSRPRKKNYFGKDCFRWSSTPTSSRTRTLQHNIVQEKEGVKQGYKNVLNQFVTRGC